MHTTVIAAKRNFVNQWQVGNCRVNVGDVIGCLAKSQVARRETRKRFEGKSEGGNSTTQSQVGYLSRGEFRLDSVLDTSCRR